MPAYKALSVALFITLLSGFAYALGDDTMNHPKHHHHAHHAHATRHSGVTANDRNEYAHERSLRESGAPTVTPRGSKRLSDDSVHERGDTSPAQNGTGVFEDHHVSGASR